MKVTLAFIAKVNEVEEQSEKFCIWLVDAQWQDFCSHHIQCKSQLCYNGLGILEFKHLRINYGKEFAGDRKHINGIKFLE